MFSQIFRVASARHASLRVVHFFLADYECGINVAALKDVILGVHRTGCLDLWIYSSYLAEVGTSDVVHLDEVEYTHEMERVTFQSTSVFSMALFPWFVEPWKRALPSRPLTS